MERHRKNSSLFQLINRKSFDALVNKHQMDKWVSEFHTWEFTCALITSMTLKLSSYRDVQETLGIPRSTFGDAMNERFHGFFQDLCDLILLGIRGKTQDRKIKRAAREILAIDSTECQVHGSIFSLPNWQPQYFKGHKGGCKLHVVYNVDGQWIDDFKITGVRKHDSPIGFQLRLLSGKFYVFDRAYNGLDFWFKIIDAGSDFVTRLKDCKKIRELQAEVIKEKPNQDGVLWDGFYIPSLPQVHQHRDRLESTQLRHIIYRDPESKKVFHFVSSDMKSTPQKIAAIYKRRWAIELLFRWLKGHLDIRYLAVKNSNAVKIQLAIAVLVQLLLQLKKLKIKFNGTLWDLLRKIRSTLIRKTLSGSSISDGCRWKSLIAKDYEGTYL